MIHDTVQLDSHMHIVGIEVNLTNVSLYYVPVSISKAVIYLGAVGFYPSNDNRMLVGKSDLHHIWLNKPLDKYNTGVSLIVCPYIVCLEI